jgi:hypothetical protein
MRKSQFTRGQSTFLCGVCRRRTRDTGSNGQCELCPHCYEIAGLDNMLNDERSQRVAENYIEAISLLAACVKLGGDEKAIRQSNEYAFPVSEVQS